jgi:hypothetical protein
VLENPLRFAPIEKIQAVADDTLHSPPSSALRAGHQSSSSSSTVDRMSASSSSGSTKELVAAPVVQSLDLNHALWQRLGGGVAALTGSRQSKFRNTPTALPEDTSTWRVADRPGLMATKVSRSMVVLCCGSNAAVVL